MSSEFTDETAGFDDVFEVELVELVEPEPEFVIGVTDPIVDDPTLTIVGDCAGKVEVEEVVDVEEVVGVEVVEVAVEGVVVDVFEDVPTFVEAITFDPLVPPAPELEPEPVEAEDPVPDPLDDPEEPLERVLPPVDGMTLGTSKRVYRGELVSGSSPLPIPNDAGETLRYLTSADLGTHT